MADRNLAHMIWELSQQEENNDAKDLKQYFKKKVKSSQGQIYIVVKWDHWPKE